MECKPPTFGGHEGAVGLLKWFEGIESAFTKCNCPPSEKVRYATGTLEGTGLVWWSAQVQMLGVELAHTTPWEDFKHLIREKYCSRVEIQKLDAEFYNL